MKGLALRPANMDFVYRGAFRARLPHAYKRLIVDAMLGDPTLFMGADEVEEQWAAIDGIVASWRRDRPSFPNYAAGRRVPAASDELAARDGHEWKSR